MFVCLYLIIQAIVRVQRYLVVTIFKKDKGHSPQFPYSPAVFLPLLVIWNEPFQLPTCTSFYMLPLRETNNKVVCVCVQLCLNQFRFQNP